MSKNTNIEPINQGIIMNLSFVTMVTLIKQNFSGRGRIQKNILSLYSSTCIIHYKLIVQLNILAKSEYFKFLLFGSVIDTVL